MALKNLVTKSRKIHDVELHGEKLKFAELGFDEEAEAKAQGIERAKRILEAPTTDEQEEYATLYVHLMMLRKGGEDATDDDYFALSSSYHNEIVMAIGDHVANVVHAEGKKMREMLREKLLAEGKRRLES